MGTDVSHLAAFSDNILKELFKRGMIPITTQRIVLDITLGNFVVCWTQTVPDPEMLKVIFDDPHVHVQLND